MSTDTPAHGLTTLALQGEPILRRVLEISESGGPEAGASRIAGDIGRDPANVRKSMIALEEAGLLLRKTAEGVEFPRLTAAGLDVVAALDRAAGVGVGASAPAGYVLLRHSQIVPDPDNARTSSGLTAEEIDEMADSLAEQGMLQAPRVRLRDDGLYQLVAGERRWRGWGKLLDRGTWDADTICPCSLDQGDDQQRLEAGLVENLQRSDLSNLEIAEGLLTLHERHARTMQQMAKTIGKTDRFVQIAVKVAKGASPENKQKFTQSETAYREGRARGESVKRTFTWEELRDSVTVPKYLTALERRGRITLLVAELAWKTRQEECPPIAVSGEPMTRISTPPGGGYFAEAEGMGLLVDLREDGKVFAGVTKPGWDWLAANGFDDDEDAWLRAIRLDVLGALGEAICRESGRFGMDFVNPPKPAPPAPEPAHDPEVEEEASAAPAPGVTVWQPPLPPPRDDFAAAIREVNATADPAPQPPPAAQPAPIQASASPAAPAADLPPGLKDAEFIALVELAHKITRHGFEVRGGALRGALVGAFHSGPGAAAAQALTFKRLVSFVQVPTGFAGVLSTQAWDLVDGSVDDGRLREWQAEHWSGTTAEWAAFVAIGAYQTAWLNTEEVKAAPVPRSAEILEAQAEEAADDAPFAHRPEHPMAQAVMPDLHPGDSIGPEPLADLTAQAETHRRDEDEGAAVDFLRQDMKFVVFVAREADTLDTTMAFATELEAREIGEVLALSGRYDEVQISDQHGRLVQFWGRE